MPTLTVTIRNKIASASTGAVIICGNTGYKAAFDLDEEWAQYAVKTARFAYVRNGVRLYQDVLFAGSTVDVPVMWDVQAVSIGLYAGSVLTSTAAVVPCTRSATDDEAEHPDPAPDVYDQLLEYLAGMQGGGTVHGAASIHINGIVSAATHGTAETLEV